MGQLNTKEAIFLSASVPDPSAPHFVGPGDSVAIAASVSALLEVVIGRRPLVWGGHPAITPMVWAFAEAMGVDYGNWVTLYQSLFFEDEFPEETAKFKNVVFTDMVSDELDENLAHMRLRMITEHDWSAAVFIGGMKGVFKEFGLFREHAPGAKILPIASTGGAAEHLLRGFEDRQEILQSLNYAEIFYEMLGIHPNERRYTSPLEQPTRIEQRLVTRNERGG